MVRRDPADEDVPPVSIKKKVKRKATTGPKKSLKKVGKAFKEGGKAGSKHAMKKGSKKL